jgi:hypothetical protein
LTSEDLRLREAKCSEVVAGKKREEEKLDDKFNFLFDDEEREREGEGVCTRQDNKMILMIVKILCFYALVEMSVFFFVTWGG